MRNTFVVLVSLCIGVVSGFIVPSSAPEIPSNSTTESISDANTTSSKYTVLPKSRSDIDEKDLYEHATERQNNQSERAFIYINQKFKKPVRNRLIKISPLDHQIVYATAPPPTVPDLATPCPITSRATYSYFKGFDISDKLPQEMASYFADPTVFRCKDNDKNSNNNNINSNNNNINPNNNNINPSNNIINPNSNIINPNYNNINPNNNNIHPNYNNINPNNNNINPNYNNKNPDYTNKNANYNNKNSDYNNKNFNYNNKIITDTSPMKLPPQPLNRMDEQREYFELLKPPMVRPMNRINTKPNYESILQNGFVSLSPSSVPFKDNFLRTYNLKAPYAAKPKVAFKQPDEIRNKNYGFDDSYIRRPFQTKDVINRVEDVNFVGDFVNDDDTPRLYENNQEDDKLLDKYLKDTLEEQNVPDCSYRECILQSAKPPTNNGRLLKPDCKCGKRLNIKQIDPFIIKDRALREESKHNDTDTNTSSEVNYYEEMLSEDLNVIKHDDDVVRPPNKVNETYAA